MKLLFDANLSPKLVGRLSQLFPESTHVFQVGLVQRTSDEAIWQYAKDRSYTIVTADSDFLVLAAAHGTPPYVVRLEDCDYPTAVAEDLLRRNAIRIAALEAPADGVLIIRK